MDELDRRKNIAKVVHPDSHAVDTDDCMTQHALTANLPLKATRAESLTGGTGRTGQTESWPICSFNAV